jgi:hypothetical protein
MKTILAISKFLLEILKLKLSKNRGEAKKLNLEI